MEKNEDHPQSSMTLMKENTVEGPGSAFRADSADRVNSSNRLTGSKRHDSRNFGNTNIVAAESELSQPSTKDQVYRSNSFNLGNINLGNLSSLRQNN
jgi:hypothetical protein